MGEVVPATQIKNSLDLLLPPGDALAIRQQQIIIFKRYPSVTNALMDRCLDKDCPADIKAITLYLTHLRDICQGVRERYGTDPMNNMADLLAQMGPTERTRLAGQIMAAMDLNVEALDEQHILMLHDRVKNRMKALGLRS